MQHAVIERTPTATPARTGVPSGEVFATQINLSGRRRFTSQRVVLYAVLAARGTPDAAQVAKDALTLFCDAHHTLVQGLKDAGDQASPALREAYFGPPKGDRVISGFIELAQRVLHGIEAGWRHQLPVLLDELVASTTPLLATLNSITSLYEQEARNHAKQVERHLHGAMDEIKSISKQAQVVAVNARIVAARAGSAGREFALVASELISITSGIDTILATTLPRSA